MNFYEYNGFGKIAIGVRTTTLPARRAQARFQTLKTDAMAVLKVRNRLFQSIRAKAKTNL